jgi:hypothetical protein
MLSIIDSAVYMSCDAADGVKDGLIRNPSKCSFDPNYFARVAKTRQLVSRKITSTTGYLGPVIDKQGLLVSPGQTPTDSSTPGGMVAWTTGLTPTDQLYRVRTVGRGRKWARLVWLGRDRWLPQVFCLPRY